MASLYNKSLSAISGRSASQTGSLRHIALGAVDIQEADIQRVTDTLRAGRVSPGSVQRELEDMVAMGHGKVMGTMVNSGQSALHLALLHLKGLGVKRVICPAVTYISTLHAVWNAGLEVVLVDVDPTDWLMEYPQARAEDALLPVDLFGKAWLPNARGPIVVEDACEAIGAPGVGYGDIVCFSFYASHSVTTGSGGMAITSDEGTNDHIKRLANHGRRDASDLYLQPGSGKRFIFDEVGYSYKSSDLNAALAIGQYKRLQGMIWRRRMNAEILLAALQRLPLQLANPERHTFQMFPLLMLQKGLRDHFMDYLTDRGIECREAMPIVTQPVVQRMLGGVDETEFPNAYNLATNGLYVGVHHLLSTDDLDYMIEVIRGYFK